MNNLGNPLDTPFGNTTPQSINNSSSDSPLSPSGRFTRLSFLAWNFILAMSFSCIFTILFSLGLTGYAISAVQDPTNSFSHPLTIISILLAVLLCIAFIASIIIICIRRLHDLNKSGWLALLIFIPLIGTIFSIYIFVARGTKERNAYGAFRPTEQAEKFLGYLYLAFMAVFLVFYVALLSIVMTKPEIFQQLPSMVDSEITSNTAYPYGDDSENHTPVAPPIEQNVHIEETQQRPLHVNRDTSPQIEASEDTQTTAQIQLDNELQRAKNEANHVQQSAEDAVRDAQAAAEAAVNVASSQ
ncbi:DUF805 domain-containing protein [Acinetobacter sp. TY1]|uniref:DUF805 domain-containing protein n=1 Tax=Acinetobacter sp. TY1 TaxID=3387626 RepID=UPI003AF4FFB0